MKEELLVLKIDKCTLPGCDCGFNIKVGGGYGDTEKSLKTLINFLKTKYNLRKYGG